MAWTEKYVTTSGTEAWATNSSGNPSSLAEAISNCAAGERINVKAGTYSSGTTIRSFTVAGTDTAPIWWRGYKTTAGDLDSRPTTQRTEATDMPLFTSTTGYYNFTGNNQKVSNIHFTSAPTAGGSSVLMLRGDHMVIFRCRAISSSSSRGAVEGSLSQQVLLQECYIENTTTGADVLSVPGGGWAINSCIIRGGDIGVKCTSNQHMRIVNTLIHDSAESNIDAGGFLMVCNSTLYNAGLDNIRIRTTAQGDLGVILNNVFDTSGGYAINQTTGTDTTKILIANNSYRDGSFTSGRLNGVTESLEFESINETVIPFENAGSLDFTLKDTASGYGQDILFEVDGPNSYRDLGAIQHQDAGGGGGFRRISLNGGFNG